MACGYLLWADASSSHSRLSTLGQVQIDSILQLLCPLLVMFTLKVTRSESSAHRLFCTFCALAKLRSVTLQCSLRCTIPELIVHTMCTTENLN